MRQSPRLPWPTVLLTLTLGVTGADAQRQTGSQLAPAPERPYSWLDPPDLLLEEPDASPEAARLAARLRAKALSVDTGNRSAVATFYHTVYTPAFSVPMGWTGSVAGCVAGSTSQAYLDATIDVINYFRAMTNLPSITNDDGLTDEAQAAALIMDANNDLSHSPPSSWHCYTLVGAQGAANSNLALYSSGPSAIVAYVRDGGLGNEPVGHRRWILYPPRLQMAPGSTPGANALWVFSLSGSRPTSPALVSWPPAGYVPYQVVYSRWSLSLNSVPGADYSAARVTMTEGGSSIPVTIVSQNDTRYGDSTIVWQPTNGLYFGAGQADRRIRVTVTNIGGGTPSVAYDVIVIDPATVPTAIFDDGFEGGSTSAWSSAVP